MDCLLVQSPPKDLQNYKNYFNISNQNLSKGFKGLRHASKPRLSAKRVAKRDAEPLQQRGLTCRGQPPCKGSDGDGDDDDDGEGGEDGDDTDTDWCRW